MNLTRDPGVEKIMVEDNKAVGIVLADGSEHRADVIVSTADGHETLYKMLDGRYTNETIDRYYQGYGKEQAFGLQIYLGLNRTCGMSLAQLYYY